MLSPAERRVLTLHCFDHTVATCEDCRRDYKFSELGVDIVWRRYYFCPSCRVDLVDDLRLHILGCRAIAAALEERIERSQLLMKESNRLATASELLAAESRALVKRVIDAKRVLSHVPVASTVFQQVVGVLAECGSLCASCLAYQAHLHPENVREAIDAIGAHIRITARPGTCPECGREDIVLSFGDGTSADHSTPPTD